MTPSPDLDPFDENGQPPDTINTVILLHDGGHHQIDGPHPYNQAAGQWETRIDVETDISNHSAFQEHSARQAAEDRVGDSALAMADGCSVAWGEILDAEYDEDKHTLWMRVDAAGVPTHAELVEQGAFE